MNENLYDKLFNQLFEDIRNKVYNEIYDKLKKELSESLIPKVSVPPLASTDNKKLPIEKTSKVHFTYNEYIRYKCCKCDRRMRYYDQGTFEFYCSDHTNSKCTMKNLKFCNVQEKCYRIASYSYPCKDTHVNSCHEHRLPYMVSIKNLKCLYEYPDNRECKSRAWYYHKDDKKGTPVRCAHHGGTKGNNEYIPYKPYTREEFLNKYDPIRASLNLDDSTKNDNVNIDNVKE